MDAKDIIADDLFKGSTLGLHFDQTLSNMGFLKVLIGQISFWRLEILNLGKNFWERKEVVVFKCWSWEF